MKSFLILIVAVGLLVVGWKNRDRFIKAPEQSASNAEEPAVGLDLPSSGSVPRVNAPSSTPHPARDAQARATAIYPGIARANSPLNQKFVALYKEAQATDPALLSRPDWPLELADRAVIALGGAPMPRTAASSGGDQGSTLATVSQSRLSNRIVMYTTSHCPFCTKAKRYFSTKGISYREVNIETSLNGKEEYRQLNGNGVPLIMIDGKRVQGFDQVTLDQLLNRTSAR